MSCYRADGQTVVRAYTPTSSDEDLGFFDLVIKVFFHILTLHCTITVEPTYSLAQSAESQRHLYSVVLWALGCAVHGYNDLHSSVVTSIPCKLWDLSHDKLYVTGVRPVRGFPRRGKADAVAGRPGARRDGRLQGPRGALYVRRPRQAHFF